LAIVTALLLIAGFSVYFFQNGDGRDLLRNPRKETAAAVFDVRSVTGFYATNTVGGKLFVLAGEVMNRGKVVGKGILVRGSLLGGDSRVIAEKSVYAGTVLSQETLRHSDPAKIEEALSTRPGTEGRILPPGEHLSFMIVFPGVPKGVSSFRISAGQPL
jgi:TRAP-type C4-dicarboxylate transport system permease large subunit